MTFTDPLPNGNQDLPPQVKELYRQALLHQEVAAGAPGLPEAVELGVLAPGTHVGGYRATEPDLVISRLVDDATHRIAEISAFIAGLPSLRQTLTQIYRETLSSDRSGQVEHLHGNSLINERIEEAISCAAGELITAQPGGPRTRELLDRSIPRDTEALERGVKMRTLYHATARHSPLTQEWAKVMADKGGEIRTLDAPFLRMVIIDRKSAFIQDFLYRDADEPGNAWAHLIKDPAVCAFIAEIFERDWNHADYWHGSEEGAVISGVTTRMQRAILRQLSSGRTQEQTARDLGLSTRTLQKHLTSLRTRVPHLQSVPQMTYWWATCPDRVLD
jgi:hypothetical protein